MRIVVDLPAPLLPRKPKISPRPTSNDTSSTATNAPNRRVRCRTSMALDMVSASRAGSDPGGRLCGLGWGLTPNVDFAVSSGV